MTTLLQADPHDDLRPLSNRVVEDCRDVIDRMIRDGLVQSILAGTLTREDLGALLGQVSLIHAKLDAVILAERAKFPELARLVPDSRLSGDSAARDAAHFGASGAPKPLKATAELIDAIEKISRIEPFKLMGLHFARESARNVNRYLAVKLRAAFGLGADSRDGFEHLDPYRAGQRPVWERFKRDFDKLRLSEPERQSLAAGARLFYEKVADIHEELGVTAPDGTVRKLPVGF